VELPQEQVAEAVVFLLVALVLLELAGAELEGEGEGVEDPASGLLREGHAERGGECFGGLFQASEEGAEGGRVEHEAGVLAEAGPQLGEGLPLLVEVLMLQASELREGGVDLLAKLVEAGPHQRLVALQHAVVLLQGIPRVAPADPCAPHGEKTSTRRPSAPRLFGTEYDRSMAGEGGC
jgi:hypothetical protein